jgi:hypothetical protein
MPSEVLRTLRTYVRLKQKHKHPAGRRRRPPDRLRNPRRVRPRARRKSDAKLRDPSTPLALSRHQPATPPRRPHPGPGNRRAATTTPTPNRRPLSPASLGKHRGDLMTLFDARAVIRRVQGVLVASGEPRARGRGVAAPREARAGGSAPPIGRSRAATKRGPGVTKNRRRPTLPGGCPPSTIGAEWLNCSVRNGKRCLPLAMCHRNFARPPRWSLKTAQGLQSK